MVHYAIGIIQHPITGRWQPWIYTEDAGTISLACLSSHTSKAFARLVGQLCLDAHQAGKPFDMEALLRQSQESDVPDPLPQATIDALIADIQHAATAASPPDTILGYE
jgi:hypothetical protein